MSPRKGDILLIKMNSSQYDQTVEVQEDYNKTLYINLSFGKIYVNAHTLSTYELIKLTKPSIINRLKKYNYK